MRLDLFEKTSDSHHVNSDFHHHLLKLLVLRDVNSIICKLIETLLVFKLNYVNLHPVTQILSCAEFSDFVIEGYACEKKIILSPL